MNGGYYNRPIGLNAGGSPYGIAQSMVTEEELEQQRRQQHQPMIASQSGNGLRDIGMQVGKQFLTGALSGATGGIGGIVGTLFKNEGGPINTGGPLSAPPQAGAQLPAQARQILEDVVAGLVSPEKALEMLMQMGIQQQAATELLQGIMQSVKDAQEVPVAKNTGGPIKTAADQLLNELDSRSPAGLKLPTQTFNVGGVPMSAAAMSVLSNWK